MLVLFLFHDTATTEIYPYRHTLSLHDAPPICDLALGQLSHVDPDAFEVGVNTATTPGKVIHETDLYQLIQYSPTTKQVFTVPLVIFPPWINRFYILDLNPAKSFVAWAAQQGLSEIGRAHV